MLPGQFLQGSTRIRGVKTCTQAKNYWVGVERFQKMLLRYLRLPDLVLASTQLDRLIRIGSQCKNPFVNKMVLFLTDHQAGLLAFHLCLHSGNHLLQRLSRSQQKWIPLTKSWALPITTNAAEHVFRCLRRYTKPMGHFGTEAATQRLICLSFIITSVSCVRINGPAILCWLLRWLTLSNFSVRLTPTPSWVFLLLLSVLPQSKVSN